MHIQLQLTSNMDVLNIEIDQRASYIEQVKKNLNTLEEELEQVIQKKNTLISYDSYKEHMSSAYAIMKLCASDMVRLKKCYVNYMRIKDELETHNRIGISYNIHADLTDTSLDDIKHMLQHNCPQCVGTNKGAKRKNPLAQHQIKKFIDMPIGSNIIIGIGLDKALYLATIASDYEYNTDFYFPHTRRITNLIKLPEDMKTGTKTRDTFKLL